MERPITGFRRDADSHWVAELSCGHRQHLRHDPPFLERAWVTREEGRAERLGTPLDCVRCDRFEIPEGYEVQGQSAVFTDATVPDALLTTHTTKPGVWGRIRVNRGELVYHIDPPLAACRILTPDAPGVVVPEVEHRVECNGPVEFFVEFWRRRDHHAYTSRSRPVPTS